MTETVLQRPVEDERPPRGGLVVALCMPVYESVEYEAFNSILDLLMRYTEAEARRPISDSLTTGPIAGGAYRLKRLVARGQPVSVVRNKLAREALACQGQDNFLVGTGAAADVVLWQDSDVSVHDPLDYIRLVEALDAAPDDVGIMGAPLVQQERTGKILVNVNMTGIPGGADAADMHRPFECTAIGFGLVAVRRTVFEVVPWPWFEFKENEDGSMSGEDMGFCDKARLAGFRVACDPRIEASHAFRRAFSIRDVDLRVLLGLSER